MYIIIFKICREIPKDKKLNRIKNLHTESQHVLCQNPETNNNSKSCREIFQLTKPVMIKAGIGSHSLTYVIFHLLQH